MNSKKGFIITTNSGSIWLSRVPSDILAIILKKLTMILPIDFLLNQLINNGTFTNRINLGVYSKGLIISLFSQLKCTHNYILNKYQKEMIEKSWNNVCCWEKTNLKFKWKRRTGQTVGLIFLAGIILQNTQKLKINILLMSQRSVMLFEQMFKQYFGIQYIQSKIIVFNSINLKKTDMSADLFLVDGCNLDREFKLLTKISTKMIICYNYGDENNSNTFMKSADFQIEPKQKKLKQ